MVDTGGLIFTALIVVAIPFAIRDVRHRHGKERTLGTIGVVAAALLAASGGAKELGWLSDGPFYQTLRLSLTFLFLAMLYQVVRFGKRSAPSEGPR